MADKYLHLVRNGIIAIIATVVGGLILSALPQIRGFLADAMSWAWAGVTWIWTALISYYSMPGWAFLIVGLLALVSLVGILVGIYVVLRPKNEPEYKNYTEDILDGAKWRWSWTAGKISNLWCFCPSCDAQLVYSESYGEPAFICERCPPNEFNRYHCHYDRPQGRVVTMVKGSNIYYAVSAAEREILRRIRVKEYVHSRN